MKYKDFIRLIEQHQTPHIKPLAFPASCAIGSIPDVFGSFIPEILKIMETCHPTLSAGKPFLGVFGLQPVSMSLESEEPHRLSRIFDAQKSHQHLCYTIAYLPATAIELQHLTHWNGSDSLIVDFTRGHVLDKERYLFELFKIGNPGNILGQLNKIKLNLAWQNLSKNSLH
jgi:hypothetical protein